jgi:uncharacterized protein (DUF1015 family)
MPEVLPFKGIIYSSEKVKGEEVVSPPYDIITPDMKEELYQRSPYNVVRIDFGKDYEGDNETNNRYTRAAEYLKKWLKEGVLLYTDEEAYYLYEVEYAVRGERRLMRGIFGRVRITELCEGVYPHEATHSKPKTDRLNILRYCKANLSPIFSIYNRPNTEMRDIFNKYVALSPYMEAFDSDGFKHRMWIIQDRSNVQRIREALRDITIYIADGHHRYETALQYMKERLSTNPSHSGQEPYNYVLMYLVNIADGGITILPTHRLVKGLVGLETGKLLHPLKKFFDIVTVDTKDAVVEIMKHHKGAIGLALREERKGFLLTYKGGDLSEIKEPLRGLEVTILHELIFKKVYNIKEIDFEMDPVVAIRRMEKEGYDGVFFLNPTRIKDVEEVALNCLRMPPKSTYFYPKILTGFVINPLEGDLVSSEGK